MEKLIYPKVSCTSMDFKLVFELLFRAYGPQGWWPLHGRHNGKDPSNEDEIFEVMAGAVLTQNTSWRNVEKALHNLRADRLLSRQAIVRASERRIAQLVRPAGYYNQKAKKLKILAYSHAKTRDELLALWGIGPETADSILLYAYGQPYFVIDSYTKRIFSRLGVECKTYDEWQNLFMKSLPADVKLYKEYHALIVEHAKRHCRAKPLCECCVLAKICRHK